MHVHFLIILVASTSLLAQTIPSQFKTSDADLQGRLFRVWNRLAEPDAQSNELGSQLAYLTALPANAIYRQMDSAARVAALQQTLPLLKALVLSEAVRKAHDERIAREYGAANHNIPVGASADPMRRYEELGRMMQKNPKVMSDPKFMKEFSDLGNKISGDKSGGGSGVGAPIMQQDLTRYTRPIAELQRDVAERRKSASGADAKCFDEALALADTKPDAFRLRSARCHFQTMGIQAAEPAIDKERKEMAQALYNRLNLRALVKQNLGDFVATAATVDFAAATTSKGMKLVFTNPVYEKKSLLWKMIYRNGKAPTDAAVAFAKAWMAEL